MKKSCIKELDFFDKANIISGERHRHNLYQMIYVVKGSIRLEAAESVYDCGAPCLIFISNLEPHSISVKTHEYERYIMSIDPAQAEQEIKPARLLSIFSTHRTDFCHCLDISEHREQFDMLIKLLFDEYNRDEEMESDSADNGETLWLCALLHRIFRIDPYLFRDAESMAEKTVVAVKAELERDLSGVLNLDGIAEKYFISRYYLAHIFKTVTGYSVKQYALLCRLSYARELLSTTNMNIEQVAQASGFNDTSNFTRYFREKIGKTPSQYRESEKETRRVE